MLSDLATALATEAQDLRDRISPPLRERLLGLRSRPATSVGGFFSEEEWIDACAQTQAWYRFALDLRNCGRIDRRGLRWIIQQRDPLWKEILETSGAIETTVSSRADRRCRSALPEERVWRRLLQQFAESGASESCLSDLFELFLAEFDSGHRRRRGAYFTPPEIAQRLVRDVDTVLRSDFQLELGLADCATWQEVLHDDAPANAAENGGDCFVRILDPAAGSGVFLVAALEHIHATLKAVWREAKTSEGEMARFWSIYVTQDLLPRLLGLELSPAACLAAHLEIAQKLAQTGYDFGEPARVQVFAANTLAGEEDGFTSQLPVTVILGNPPFAALSQNRSGWIAGLLKGQTAEGVPTASYFNVDGQPLGERKHWLHDDYVKFLRYAQWRIEKTGCGVVGLVTNHSYLDNPTFRGVRRQLMQSFSRIDVIDLHGNRKKRETAPNGQRDENVFPIDQGVALSVLCRRPGAPLVRRADVWGTRDEKRIALSAQSGCDLQFATLAPTPPFYFFTSRDESLREEYDRGWPLPKVMPIYVAAPVTARDGLVVAFTREELRERIAEFRDLSISDDSIRARYFGAARTSRYPRGDTRGWKLSEVRRRLAEMADWEAPIRRCLYRPFDRRWIYWSEQLIDWPRRSVMRRLESPGNCAFIARRQMPPTEPCRYFWITSEITVDGVIRSDNRGGESVFPLFLRDGVRDGSAAATRVNFATEFLELLGIEADGVGAWRLLGYIYALFHSPTYRQRYAEHLRIDFPRVFVPRDARLLREMGAVGLELAMLHCGRQADPEIGQEGSIGPERVVGPDGVGSLFRTTLVSSGDGDRPKTTPDPVAPGFPKFDGSAVWINPREHFAPVPREAWEWQVGGHQVCRKWLKDRKGRVLTNGEIVTYGRIVQAATETQRLMEDIDRLIDRYGGWPGAFALGP